VDNNYISYYFDIIGNYIQVLIFYLFDQIELLYLINSNIINNSLLLNMNRESLFLFYCW